MRGVLPMVARTMPDPMPIAAWMLERMPPMAGDLRDSS
jgi:hypothetical protein